ncbi:MAG: LuxR C-terminal-related transcriptional regulator [Cyanobacteria bacterium J06621_8]
MPSDLIDPTRLLFELQKINLLNQSLSGCLQPELIATKITDGLVQKFDCAFARVWIVEAELSRLKLIASSGLYTRLDGDFATVSMGSYKVGKIAQNCIPFLSNQLANESWVKDREWAIKHKICGFAGLPLTSAGESIGVLAVFSHNPMEPEFLEALKILCSSVAVTLNNADVYQKKSQINLNQQNYNTEEKIPLSEQIDSILSSINLTLLGTEKPLNTANTYILLKIAEELKSKNCSYCRLTYASDRFYLEAMLIESTPLQTDFISQNIISAINFLDGYFKINHKEPNLWQIEVSFPYQEQHTKCAHLSPREKEVIQLLIAGMRDREIAAKLFISDRTVKFHINNVMQKFNAKTRIQTIYMACSNGCLH